MNCYAVTEWHSVESPSSLIVELMLSHEQEETTNCIFITALINSKIIAIGIITRNKYDN